MDDESLNQGIVKIFSSCDSKETLTLKVTKNRTLLNLKGIGDIPDNAVLEVDYGVLLDRNKLKNFEVCEKDKTYEQGELVKFFKDGLVKSVFTLE